MPAKTTIFNAKAEATHNFALGPRNTILFSPHGRFVLVAGFGNLAGHVDIYDLSKNYFKVCTIIASNASVCEWSPDGTHILFATTSPRLRVDNGVRIFHVGGGLMYFEEMTELYHVTWRPQSPTQHPIPRDPLNPIPEPHASAKAVLATVKPPTKPAGAYRPPGARGTSTPMHFKREDEGGAAYIPGAMTGLSGANGFGKPKGRREVPGAEFVEATLPPGAAPGGGVMLTEDNIPKGPRKSRTKRGPKGKEQVPQQVLQEAGNANRGPAPAAAAPVTPPPIQNQIHAAGAPIDLNNIPAGNGPQDKKVRSLLKKLRAIEDLKMRQAAGEKLEATQVQKIQTEESVRKELDAVGAY
jgi:translation initiation factor 2A